MIKFKDLLKKKEYPITKIPIKQVKELLDKKELPIIHCGIRPELKKDILPTIYASIRKSHLNEDGGNISIESNQAEPIHISERENKKKDINEFLHSLNKTSENKLFSNHENALKNLTAFSGSTKHFMNPNILSKQLGQIKQTFGDIDVQIPKEQKDNLKMLLQPNAKYGNFSILGTKAHGSEISALVKHHKDNKIHQIDFELSDFNPKTQEPTEFSQFAHNSDLDDMKYGLKGKDHKIFLSSIAQANKPRKYAISLQGIRDVEGKEYDQDLKNIHLKLFGHRRGPVHPQDIKDLHSIHGLVNSMKKYFTPEQINNVMDHYGSGGGKDAIEKVKNYFND